MPTASGPPTGNFRGLLSISCVVSNIVVEDHRRVEGRPEITAVTSKPRFHTTAKASQKPPWNIINPASKDLKRSIIGRRE
jgi:hypothetical protein